MAGKRKVFIFLSNGGYWCIVWGNIVTFVRSCFIELRHLMWNIVCTSAVINMATTQTLNVRLLLFCATCFGCSFDTHQVSKYKYTCS